jgi:cytochrome P450
MLSSEADFATPIHAGPAPPGKPLSFLKYLRTIGDNVIAGYDVAVYEELILRRGFPGTTHFIVNDPAGIKRVLIDNVANYKKGEMEHRVSGLGMSGKDAAKLDKVWRARRRMVASSLDYRSYPAFASTVSDSTIKILAAWEGLAPGTEVDLQETMRDLTCEVMARVLFSVDHKEVAGVNCPGCRSREAGSDGLCSVDQPAAKVVSRSSGRAQIPARSCCDRRGDRKAHPQ